MPQLGEIRLLTNIGGRDTTRPRKYVWLGCDMCGKERWVSFYKAKARGFNSFCPECYMGGVCQHRYLTKQGYVMVKIYPDDPFFPMACRNRGNNYYILEHRLVMAKHLGRCLTRQEMVHHKGDRYPVGTIEDKQDNRGENLRLVGNSKHSQITGRYRQVAILEKRLKLIKEEIMELEAM